MCFPFQMQQQEVASCASESVPERMQLPASAGEFVSVRQRR